MPMVRCLHDKTRTSCRDCFPQNFCEHDRNKYVCRDCAGSSICIHLRQRSSCKQCMAANLCVHSRFRRYCRECKGVSICVHGNRRYRCTECKGVAVCEHFRRRDSCVDCHGTGICEHLRQRSTCKDCDGGAVCEHHRRRSVCKECGGGSICKHFRNRSRCKECGGGSICDHGVMRNLCVDCGGGSICEHGVERRKCKACGGSFLCATPLCETHWNPTYKPYCARCFVFLNPDSPLLLVRNFKTKEYAVREFILSQFPGLPWICDRRVADGCSLRRPDLMLDLGSHVLFIEIDENGHDFGYTCTNKRLCELFQDAGERPSCFLRFNPDSYMDTSGQRIPSCWTKNAMGVSVIKDEKMWNARLCVLASAIQQNLTKTPQKLIHIEQLFFSSKVSIDDGMEEPKGKKQKFGG